MNIKQLQPILKPIVPIITTTNIQATQSTLFLEFNNHSNNSINRTIISYIKHYIR